MLATFAAGGTSGPPHPALPPLPVAPWALSGTVYGALLNHRPQLAALGDALHRPPHQAPPRAPVLEIKPRHMLAAAGSTVRLPAGTPGLVVGASLGIVIGRLAYRVPAAQALQHVAGYLVLGDCSLPLPGHYRPSARLKARDGFCPIGPRVMPAAQVPHPDVLPVQVRLDGRLAQATDTGERVRGVARLVADVSAFMTLQPGDLLALGIAQGAPLAAPGQRVELRIGALEPLHFHVATEERA